MQTKKYIFHVHGMHCASCVARIEEVLKDIQAVKKAKVNLHTGEAAVEGEWKEDPDAIAKTLTSHVEKYGYTFSLEKEKKERKWNEFLYAFPIAAAFIVGFIFLQKIGLVNMITTGEVGYGTAFLIGLIASVSTCLAVVGGLALSLSANYAKEGSGWKPQMLFHGGRLIGFFILGGVIGLLGGSFRIGQTGNMILGGLVAFVMLILGVNLLDVFHGAKRFQFTMPKTIGKKIMRERLEDRKNDPAAISDGRWELYQQQKNEFEPVEENEGKTITVDTSTSLLNNVDTILRHLELI